MKPAPDAVTTPSLSTSHAATSSEERSTRPPGALFPNAPRARDGYAEVPTGPGLGLELDEDEARRRPSRDAPLPSRFWPDGGVADY